MTNLNSPSESTLISKGISNLTLVIIATLMILAPFYSGSTSPTGQALNEILLLTLVVSGYLGFYFAKRDSISFSIFELLGVGLFIIAAISAIQAIYSVDAWRAMGAMILLGLAFRVVNTKALEQEKLIRTLAYVLLASGLIQVLIATHQFFFTEWYQQAMPEFYVANLAPNLRGGVLRVVGGFINPNYFAAFLNLCLATSLGMAMFLKNRLWRRLLFLGGGLIFLSGILLSGSKGGLIASVAIVATFLLIKDRRFIWLFLIILLLLIVVPNPLRDQVVRSVSSDPYVNMRPGIWMCSLNVFADSPILGVGPENFRFASHKYAPPTDFLLVNYSRFPRIAHNTYLHNLAETGILGMIPYLLLMAALLAALAKAIKDREDGTDGSLRLGLSVGLVSIFLHSLVDNVANNRAILTVIIIISAVMLSRHVRDKEAFAGVFERKFTISSKLFGSSLSGVMVIIMVMAMLYSQIYLPYNYEHRMKPLIEDVDSQIEQFNNDLAEMNDSTDRVQLLQTTFDRLTELDAQLREVRDYYPDNLATCRYSAVVKRELFRLTGDMDYFNGALHYYRKASASLHGKSRSDAYSELTLYLDLINRGYPKTREILQLMRALADEAISNWPTRASFYLLAATIEKESGELEEAESLYKKAINLEPNYLRAIYDLSKIALLQDDPELNGLTQKLFREANERIREGTPAEKGDTYAQQILSPAR